MSTKIGDTMNVQNCIKILRQERQITQNEMADYLGVSRQTIIAIENHHYNPSLELSLKIAKYFNKHVEEIFLLESK